MQLCKVHHPTLGSVTGLFEGDTIIVLPGVGLSELLHGNAEAMVAQARARATMHLRRAEARLLAPVDAQEVWAAGVTYKRSQEARERESAGAARFYDLVYSATRPELFLKATSARVRGPHDVVCIRRDAKWSVPEPELALVISPDMQIVGYTIGNDMSSRDIEGENPLYLPQAKVYTGSCSIGPCITLASAIADPQQMGIRLTIVRGGATVFEGTTSVAAMKRPLTELVDWLGRENQFPNGAILLTGTGIVPPDAFTLALEDVVTIAIDGIGELTNTVRYP